MNSVITHSTCMHLVRQLTKNTRTCLSEVVKTQNQKQDEVSSFYRVVFASISISSVRSRVEIVESVITQSTCMYSVEQLAENTKTCLVAVVKTQYLKRNVE